MSEWTDFLSSKLPAKPLQDFYCLGLGRLAIVMGSSFFICLERPKYIFVCVTIDKASAFRWTLCPSAPTREIVYTMCVSVYSWVLKQVSHRDDHPKGSACSTYGPGESDPCLCRVWARGGGLAALTCILPVPASAMLMCQGLWVVCTLVVSWVRGGGRSEILWMSYCSGWEIILLGSVTWSKDASGWINECRHERMNKQTNSVKKCTLNEIQLDT